MAKKKKIIFHDVNVTVQVEIYLNFHVNVLKQPLLLIISSYDNLFHQLSFFKKISKLYLKVDKQHDIMTAFTKATQFNRFLCKPIISSSLSLSGAITTISHWKRHIQSRWRHSSGTKCTRTLTSTSWKILFPMND